MPSITSFLSRIKKIEADEMIDVEALAANKANYHPPPVKSLFTKSLGKFGYRCTRITGMRESKFPSSSSAATEIQGTRGTWDKAFLEVASQGSLESDPNGQVCSQVTRSSKSFASFIWSSETDKVSSNTQCSSDIRGLRHFPGTDETSETCPCEDRKTLPLLHSSRCYSPEFLESTSFLHSPVSLNSSVSGVSISKSPMNTSGDGKTSSTPFQELFSFKDMMIPVGSTEIFARSEGNRLQPWKTQPPAEMIKKPLLEIPRSIIAVASPKVLPNCVANVEEKSLPSTSMWTATNESPIDKYFRPDPLWRNKNLSVAEFDLESELDQIIEEAQIESSCLAPQLPQKEDDLMATSEVDIRKLVPRVGSGTGIGNPPHLKTDGAEPSRMVPTTETQTLKPIQSHTQWIDDNSLLPSNNEKIGLMNKKSWSLGDNSIEVLEASSENTKSPLLTDSLDERGISTSSSLPSDQHKRIFSSTGEMTITRPNNRASSNRTWPPDAFIGTRVGPHSRSVVVSKHFEHCDDFGEHLRSSIADHVSIFDQVKIEGNDIEDVNETLGHDHKISIKIHHAKNVTLNFHLHHSCCT